MASTQRFVANGKEFLKFLNGEELVEITLPNGNRPPTRIVPDHMNLDLVRGNIHFGLVIPGSFPIAVDSFRLNLQSPEGINLGGFFNNGRVTLRLSELLKTTVDDTITLEIDEPTRKK